MTKPKKATYEGKMNLHPLKLKNASQEKFREELIRIPFLGYEVETLEDGRKICITKPGGKQVFGKMKIDDFMVWIYDENKNERWRISHREIFYDIEEKGKINPEETVKIIDALERVFNGEDPDDILKNTKLSNPIGENPELLLKAYKWIWGQEDCNYPTGKGRKMSWEGWTKNKQGKWIKTIGIVDIRNKLRNKLK